MNKPVLKYRKTHIASEISFIDNFTYRQILNYDKKSISAIKEEAKCLIDKWNIKLPTTWKYELLGWFVE